MPPDPFFASSSSSTEKSIHRSLFSPEGLNLMIFLPFSFSPFEYERNEEHKEKGEECPQNVAPKNQKGEEELPVGVFLGEAEFAREICTRRPGIELLFKVTLYKSPPIFRQALCQLTRTPTLLLRLFCSPRKNDEQASGVCRSTFFGFKHRRALCKKGVSPGEKRGTKSRNGVFMPRVYYTEEEGAKTR